MKCDNTILVRIYHENDLRTKRAVIVRADADISTIAFSDDARKVVESHIGLPDEYLSDNLPIGIEPDWETILAALKSKGYYLNIPENPNH